MRTKDEVIGMIKDTLSHWDRMIKWAGGQAQEESPSSDDMEKLLGENWYASHCPLCIEFYEEDSETPCQNCPLGAKVGECGNVEEINFWICVEDSNSWEEWLSSARIFRRQIASLFREDKK